MLRARGLELDLRRHACGDPLPESVEDYAGVVVFGGPMSANDDATLPFIKRELDWISVPLAEDKPFLGICLGGQLLARALGAKVGPHEEGWHEIGYYPVRAAEAGRGLFADEQPFYQWHGEGFDLPRGAELLATGHYFRNQAFSYGRAHAIQFHPEVTREMMLRWTQKAAHRLVLPGAKPRETHLEENRLYDAGVEAWLGRFFDSWLEPAAADGDIAPPVALAAGGRG